MAKQLMDEVAFITDTRFARKKVVTVSSNQINFTLPIPAGTIIELIGRVVQECNTSLKVLVEIFIKEMYQDGRQKAIFGTFTFVTIDNQKKPTSIH